MKDKAKIPSPDKYLCNVHRKNFNDITKKSKIYAFERQSTFNSIIKDAKKTPGTGKYETTAYDEKRLRPPRGIHKTSVERFTVLDEAAVHGKEVFSRRSQTNTTRYHCKLLNQEGWEGAGV